MSQQVLLNIRCVHEGCGKTYRMRQPATGGIYKIECPYCHNAMRVNFPNPKPAAKEEKPVEPIAKETIAPTQIIHSTELSMASMGVLVKVRRFRSNLKFSLKVGKNLVGREDSLMPSDISINDDPGISRQSVNIEIHQSGNRFQFFLKVLNAKNPVLLNGREMNIGDMVSLKYGDTIQLGKTVFRFEEKG